MSIDRLTVFLANASPLHVSNRRPCRARKEERGRVCVDSQQFLIHFTSLLCHLTLPACRCPKLAGRSKRHRAALSSPCPTPRPPDHKLACTQNNTVQSRSAGARPRTAPPHESSCRAQPLRQPRRKCPREVSHHHPSTINSPPHPHPCPPWTRRPRSNHRRPRRAAAATSTTPVCTQ